MAANYFAPYRALLDALAPGQTVDLDQLLKAEGLPAVSIATRKKYLRELVQEMPEYLEKIVGFYPSVDTVIDLVELRFGKVVEQQLDASNQRCREIVEKVARPIVHRFVGTSLANHISGTTVSLSLDELMEFLLEEFVEFQRGAGNGLVSIAGSMNEALLMRAMTNAGLRRGMDFDKTGSNSEADILVRSRVGTKDSLGVEVKSYHARERLLRGLRDINGLKVGVGYFKDPSEFNPARSVTLLQADPAAIYMPDATLQQLEPKARQITTNSKIAFQSRLYRPLERFVSDMAHYVRAGNLPKD